MKRPLTDDALLDDILAPKKRTRPIPNPTLARYLEESDACRRDLAESTARFAEVNDRLEATLR